MILNDVMEKLKCDFSSAVEIASNPNEVPESVELDIDERGKTIIIDKILKLDYDMRDNKFLKAYCTTQLNNEVILAGF